MALWLVRTSWTSPKLSLRSGSRRTHVRGHVADGSARSRDRDQPSRRGRRARTRNPVAPCGRSLASSGRGSCPRRSSWGRLIASTGPCSDRCTLQGDESPDERSGGTCRNVQAAKPGVHAVGAIERCGNRRPRVERLVSAWDQWSATVADHQDDAHDPLVAASTEPTGRTRTPLTAEEVDAMRTARAQGIRVTTLARRYGVHRGTVWAKTRFLAGLT